MQRFRLLGIHVDSLNEDELYERIIDLSGVDKPCQIILLDVVLIIKARFSKKLRNVINSADLVVPISAGIRFGLNFVSGKKKTPYYNFFKFAIRLLSHFTDKNKIIYLLGGSNKKIIEKAEKNVKESFPGIRLMGRYHTKYRKDFEDKLITSIKKISPHLVIVSMKRSKQERWIGKNMNKVDKGVFVGVENFINILGGKKLSPSDKVIHSGFNSIKKAFRKPFLLFYYILYTFLLIFFKVFGLDK